MAKKEILRIRLLGAMLRRMRVFSVDTEGADRKALQFSIAVLKRGEGLVIYPEGQVSEDGKLGALHPGVVMLAQRTGVPVLPVGIVGAERVVPYGQIRLHRAPEPVRIRFGQPIPAEVLTGGLPGRRGLEHGVRMLEQAIRALSGQQQTSAQTAIGSETE